MACRSGKSANNDRFYFLELQSHCGQWFQPWNEKMLTPWKDNYDKPRQSIKNQRHHFADKGSCSQSYVFSSSHVWMWILKNWCFWTVVLKKTFESPLDCREVKPVDPKGNQPWIFIERTDAEALTLWLPNAKSQLIGKDPHAGKDWGPAEKGTTENETIGWHHWLSGHEFGQILGDSEGQTNPACCSPWGRKELDVTKQQRNKRLADVSHYVWNG